MTKMKLDLDGLAVDSFATERVEGAGTVRANELMSPINNSSLDVNCNCTVRCVPTQ